MHQTNPIYASYPWYSHPAERYPVTDNPQDVKLMQLSAKNFLVPVQELHQLLHHIANNPQFAKDLKTAASLSQEDKVKSMIQSTGIQTPIKISFSPEGITVMFQPANTAACFAIRLSLCW
ncbi:hypothetical protein [Paenibacillus guangzhouensis]|uniref:hypothetical protein n=1 Tax=Paenibacillus guangzhouensis TaxID=1473112 RepID=UPI0012668C08|nr:hypothetical protein [Paenibacillus guangzhouensis]